MAKLPKSRRKELLTPYLDNAKINWSHIAIASLIKAGYIQRVLTFNFDNVLTKACGLCGEYPAIYDYAASSASASINHLVTPSIIHLHGQGFGLTMINSEEETRQHAENLSPLIKKIMDESPIIAIGYSGEADAVFPVLAGTYNSEHSLHWCDYGEEAKSHVSGLLAQYPDHIKHYGNTDADRFLIQLAQELDCFPPNIFENPVTHLREEIRDVAPYPLAENSEYDVLEQMRQTLDTFEQTATKDTSNVIGEREVQTLLLKGHYDEIVKRKIKGDEIPESILAEAYFQQAYQLGEQADKDKNSGLYEQAFEKYAQALTIKPHYHGILYNWACDLSNLAQLNKDPALYEQTFEKYAQLLAIKSDDHDALNNWGNALSQLAELNENPELYEQAFDKYAQALTIKPDWPEALYNWGCDLASLAQLNENPALYEQAFEKYAQALTIKPGYHEALNNWGNALALLAQLNKDPAFYEQAFEMYAKALTINPGKSETLYNWGNALGLLAQLNKDPAFYEQAFEKYAQLLAIIPDDHDALHNWGYGLSSLARLNNNPTLYEQAFKKYAQALAIKPDDHNTLHNWGCDLSSLAKLNSNPALYEQAFEKYTQALAIKPDFLEALYNWGIALLHLWQQTQNSELLDQADDVIGRALNLKPDNAYNAACLAAIRNNEPLCQQHLETCLAAGTLPDKTHLKNDVDLDSVKNSSWFEQFMASLADTEG